MWGTQPRLELDEVVAGNVLASRDVEVGAVDRHHRTPGQGVGRQRVHDVGDLIGPAVELATDARAVAAAPRLAIVGVVLGSRQVRAEPLDVVTPAQHPHRLSDLREDVGLAVQRDDLAALWVGEHDLGVQELLHPPVAAADLVTDVQDARSDERQRLAGSGKRVLLVHGRSIPSIASLRDWRAFSSHSSYRSWKSLSSSPSSCSGSSSSGSHPSRSSAAVFSMSARSWRS